MDEREREIDDDKRRILLTNASMSLCTRATHRVDATLQDEVTHQVGIPTLIQSTVSEILL